MENDEFHQREYDMTVEKARAYLDQATDLDAFLFAVADEGDLNALLGYNEAENASVSLDEMIGLVILLAADGHDVHPAVLGHLATKHAVERYQG